ncbi:MAG TPA: flagellar protein FlgN [Pseudolabrys sp.]|jgi:hypothetical protein
MNVAIKVPAEPDSVAELIALIDEMIVLTAEENAILAKGLPASRSMKLRRKMELAAAFEHWVAQVSSRGTDAFKGNEALRLKVAERLKVLQVSIDENVIKLRAAIEASQRRIDAVMSAIRGRIADTAPYTANGQSGRAVRSYTANIRA